MRVKIDEKMKEWIAGYIRSHRREGAISLHVVYSKFNEDFKATFGTDPVMVVNLLCADGFIKKGPTTGGVSIWLPEDEGKGKRRPFHPKKPKACNAATKTINNQSPTPAKQQGEDEMKKNETPKEDITIEPHYSFEKVPHPETGEVNVLELIRYIMKHIDKKLPAKPDMDGGYAVVKVNVGAALRECGLSSGAVPGLSAILQNMGLLKHVNMDTWRVLHTKAVSYFVTEQSYLLARDQWLKHTARNQEISCLRRKLQQTDGDVASSETKINSTLFDDETIEILDQAERIAEELKKAETRIGELEAERDQLQKDLAERPTSVDAAKEALRERLAALKKVGAS